MVKKSTNIKFSWISLTNECSGASTYDIIPITLSSKYGTMLTLASIVWLVIGPVGVAAQRRTISPGECSLVQEVLESNPSNLTTHK